MKSIVVENLASFYHYNERILDSIGMKLRICHGPEYSLLKYRLSGMTPFRQWLSWRMRHRYRRLKLLEIQKILNAVLKEGSRKEYRRQ